MTVLLLTVAVKKNITNLLTNYHNNIIIYLFLTVKRFWKFCEFSLRTSNLADTFLLYIIGGLPYSEISFWPSRKGEVLCRNERSLFARHMGASPPKLRIILFLVCAVSTLFFLLISKLDRQRKVNPRKRKKIVNENRFIVWQIRPHSFREKTQPVSNIHIS